jgi:hypothetical protein
MQIRDIKLNSEIVRTNPSKRGDRSYIGEKFIFKVIANGLIYLKRTDKTKILIFSSNNIELPLDEFYDDWEYYINSIKLERKEKLNRLDYVIKKFDISDNEVDQFIKILQIGIIEQEKLEIIDESLKIKLENWIKINKE